VRSSARDPAQVEAIYAQDDPDACRHARSMVAALTTLPEAVRDDAMIVVTELVSNAVRHARRVAGGRIGVSLSREPDGLRIEVRDPGYGFVPSTGARDEGGFGLPVVDRLAREWGIRGGNATVVWCVLPIADAPRPLPDRG
jgi:two-component sensor histidine kinase